jgi:hypothetical protein
LISIQGESRTSLEINNFADIKRHNLPVRGSPSLVGFLNDSDYDRDLVNLLIPESNPDNFHEAIKNREGIIARCVSMEFLTKNKFRDAHESQYILDERISFHFEHFFYNKLNPYRLKFQYYVDAVFEAALNHYYYLINEPTRPKPAEHLQEEFVTRFEDLYFVLIVFFAGNCLAFLVFIAEIVWYKISQFLEKRRMENSFLYLP